MAPKSTFWIEDLDILVVKETFPVDTDFEELKSQLLKVTKLDLNECFNVVDNQTLETFTSRQLNKYSHVIAENIEFPKFKEISTLCIPVVTKEWINFLAKQKAMVPVRSFSPDPKMILKNCIVACGMDCDDEDVIKTAVRIFGGTNTSELRKSLTHFITNDQKHKNVMLIEEYNKVNREGLNVKVVRPSWLLDSIVNGRCMDENDYTLDKPAASSFEIPKYLQNISITYSQRLNLSDDLKKLLNKLVCKGNKQICIEKFLDPTISSEIPERTFDYLFSLLLYKTDHLDFNSLLFYPAKEIPVLGMHRLVVATTNYTGDSRLYIEELLQRMGGFFTKTLKPSNTHLVASKSIGKKVSYAKKWNVSIVNHCWVEDCYVNWKVLPDAHYHDLSKENESVRLINNLTFHGFGADLHSKEESSDTTNSTSIIERGISSDTGNSNNSIQCTTISKARPSISEERCTALEGVISQTKLIDILPIDQKGSKGEINATLLKESDEPKLVVDEDDVWKIPDDNEKSTETIQPNKADAEPNSNLTSEITENSIMSKHSWRTKKGNSPDQSEAPTTQSSIKRSASALSNQLEPANKTAKLTGKPYNITAIVTGFNGTLSNIDKRELKKVGITIIDTPNKNLNCIIAPSLLRTQKFLTALAYDPEYFLEPLLLTDILGTLDSVKKIGDFESLAPKLEKYDIWAHVDFEKDIKPKRLFDPNTTKDEAVKLLHKKRSNIFQQYSFNISSGLPGGFDTLKSILKSFGCKNCTNFTEKSKSVSSNVAALFGHATANLALLICGTEEKALLSHFSRICEDKKLSYIALDWNTVVTSIFQGEMKLEKNNVILYQETTFS